MDIYSRKNHRKKQCIIIFLMLVPFFIYAGFSLSAFLSFNITIDNAQDTLVRCFTTFYMPEKFNDKTMLVTFICLLVWMLLFANAYANACLKLTPGAEYGTAEWGSIKEFNKKFAAPEEKDNKILSENIRLKYDASTLKNNNMFIVGGSGAGKTAFAVSPNLLNNSCSGVYTDPKGGLLEDYGEYLKAQPYTRVYQINLCEMEKSMRFNPFVFLRKQSEIPRLIANIMKNTTPDEGLNNTADPFWDKSESMYLQAIFYYIWLECPMQSVDPFTGEITTLRKNFESVLRLLDEAEINDDGEESPLEMRFRILAEEKPRHPAIATYNRFRKGAGDTMRTVIMCANSRFNAFDNEELLHILSDNDIPLDELGTGINGDGITKSHLFVITPDDDDTWDFVPGMIYTLLFQELYRQARFYRNNALPIAVGCWFDEFANIKMPSNFERILATCRSRNVFCVPILQSLAQIKKLFKDGAWEGIVGNCDTFIYLGGNEQSTHKYISELLGKWTIDKRTTGESRGAQGSVSKNYDVLGQELLDPAQVRLLPNDKCIVLVRGEKPLIDNKWFIWEKQIAKIAKKYGRYKNDAVPREDMFVVTDRSSEYFKSINEKEKNVVVHDNLDPVEFLKMDFSEETINEHDDEEEYLMSMIDSLSSDEMDDIINEEEEATRRAKFEEFLQDYDLMSIVQIYSSELIEPERKKAIIELEKLGIDEDKIKNEVYPEIPLSEVLENVRMVKNYYAAVNS